MDMAIVVLLRDVGDGVDIISTGGRSAVGRLLGGGVLGSTIGDGGKTGDSAVETDPPAENEFKDGDSSIFLFPVRDDSPCCPPLACRGRFEALTLSYSVCGLSGIGMGDAGRFPAALDDSLVVDV